MREILNNSSLYTQASINVTSPTDVTTCRDFGTGYVTYNVTSDQENYYNYEEFIEQVIKPACLDNSYAITIANGGLTVSTGDSDFSEEYNGSYSQFPGGWIKVTRAHKQQPTYSYLTDTEYEAMIKDILTKKAAANSPAPVEVTPPTEDEVNARLKAFDLKLPFTNK